MRAPMNDPHPPPGVRAVFETGLAFQLDPFQAEHPAQLDFADTVGLILFEREGFEGTSLQLVVCGLAAEMGGQFVGDAKADFHGFSLPRHVPRVN